MDVYCSDQIIMNVSRDLLRKMGTTTHLINLDGDNLDFSEMIPGKLFHGLLEFLQYHKDDFPDYTDQIPHETYETEYPSPDEIEEQMEKNYKHIWDEYRDEVQKRISDWDLEFITRWSDQELSDIILMANFLNFRPIMDLAMHRFAQKLRGKSVEEMRKLLGVQDSGFTKEEEQRIRNENAWCLPPE